MPGPSVPAAAPTGPIPPPLNGLPWGTTRPDGQVWLNPTSLGFLQMLWAALQGSGGIIDQQLAISFAGQLAQLRHELDQLLPLILTTARRARATSGDATDFTWPIVTSEALPARSGVNIWSNAGAFNARKADCTSAIGAPKDLHGFVKAAYGAGDTAIVQFAGILDGLTGLTPGPVWLGPAGTLVSTPNTTGGQINQQAGIAVQATTALFAPQLVEGT